MADQQALPRSAQLLMVTVSVVIVISVLAGIVAAVLGGSLTNLGSGFGGLWGVPALVLTLTALVLGVAASVRIVRLLGPEAGRWRLAVLVFVGVWVVALGYSVVAHLIDPCLNGWWDGDTRVGTQPLCERFGSELNWHTRFHLAAHAVPAALLLALYLWAIRRTSGRSALAAGVPSNLSTQRERAG